MGEVVSEILSVVIPSFVKEQSFIREFLHLSPRGKSFEEFIGPGVDKTSMMRNLDVKRSPEMDKNAANEIMVAMEQLLSWLPDEMSSIVEWCRTLDALYELVDSTPNVRQLVSVMGVLETYIDEWEDSDQAFLVKTLNKEHDKLGGLFHRFVEEQVRAIEDMKVTAKKRQGVLLMFKIFPVLPTILSSLMSGIRRESRSTIRVSNSQRGS